MADVISLKGGPVEDGRKPDPEAVKAIEAIAERVRSGEIVGFVLIGEEHDGLYTSLRSGPFRTNGMIGHMERLKHRMVLHAEAIEGG